MLVKAQAALQRGAALLPWSYTPAPLGAHECLIEVKACGICHSDIHMIDNDWGMANYPVVPGHEVVGEVRELGPEVHHLRRGQRVGVGWQRSACLQCPDCLKGNENLCNENRAVIVHGYGGFADHVVVDSRFAFPLPDELSSDTAGPLLCGGITVYAALRTAGMGSGQRIGVIGIGGLGHLAVQFAARLGNRVTLFTTSADKAELAARLGVHEVVVTKSGEPPRATKPLDILLSTAPANLDWAAYLNLLDSDGTLALVGVPSEPLTVPLWPLLLKRRRILASPIGGRARMTEMLHTAADFGIEPIVERFAMADVNTALQRVRSNAVRYRAVLTA